MPVKVRSYTRKNDGPRGPKTKSRYVRRRFTKEQRLAGMIKSAKSSKTPKHLREGLKRYLRKQGVKI